MRSLFICRHLLLIVHQTQLCLLQYYLRGLSCLLCLSYKLVLSFATRQNYCLGDTDASDAAVHVAVSWMCGLLPLRLLLHFQKLLLLFTSVTWTQTHQRLPCMSPYPGCVACSFCVCSCISRNFCCCSLPLLGHRRIRCCRACRRILDVWPALIAFAPAFLKLLLFTAVAGTQVYQMLPSMSLYQLCGLLPSVVALPLDAHEVLLLLEGEGSEERKDEQEQTQSWGADQVRLVLI